MVGSGAGHDRKVMISSLIVEKLDCMRGERRLFDSLSFELRALPTLRLCNPGYGAKYLALGEGE